MFDGRQGYFCCGESVHIIKDFSKAKVTRREGYQVASGSGYVEPKKKHRFYALKSIEDQE